MKKHFIFIALLCILGNLHAQTTKVFGNLGVENVNISVINTQYGTGEKYFKNEFLKDEATEKAYGLFIRDGVYYLGLFDTSNGTVGMGQKASKVAYPRTFKVNGGYAYTVSYDRNRNQGVINRILIEK